MKDNQGDTNLKYVHQESETYSESLLELEQGQKPVRDKRKLGARTFLVPILFSLLYLVVQMFSIVLVVLVGKGSALAEGFSLGGPSQEELAQLVADPAITSWGSIVMAVILVPLMYWYIKKRAQKLPDSLLTRKTSRREWGRGMSLISLSLLLTMVWIMILGFLANYIPYVQAKLDYHDQLMKLIVSSDANYLLMLVAVVILVPIAEELLFRGIIMGEFMRVMKPAWAAVLAGLVFAVFHGNFVQSSYVVFPGIMLGLGYLIGGNLKLPIAMHMAYNFFGGFLPSFLDVENNPQMATVYTSIIIAIFIVAAGYLVWTRPGKAKQVEG